MEVLHVVQPQVSEQVDEQLARIQFGTTPKVCNCSVGQQWALPLNKAMLNSLKQSTTKRFLKFLFLFGTFEIPLQYNT